MKKSNQNYEFFKTSELNNGQREKTQKVQQLIRKIKEIKGLVKGHEEIIFEITENLRKKYGIVGASKYYLYHILGGSSGVDPKSCEHFDFPEENSILKALEVKLKEIE